MVIKVMDIHIGNGELCLNCFKALMVLAKENSDTQELIRKALGIEAVVKAMIRYANNELMCGYGCGALRDIFEANHSTQEYGCGKGCINLLIGILNIHGNHKYICEAAIEVLGMVFSSEDLYSKFCTEDILILVQECSMNHEDSDKILYFLSSLIREEDPRVKDAVAKGACTKETFPKCENDCGFDKDSYCSKCCVRQKVFRCFTCDKKEVKVYCETCWKRDHQGHKGEEFFYPVRCGTK